ncbi:C1 family peptidase [Sabulicella rubraurantiaca]|uniref:C1 family peptidase n=1 Tax=Sabulicella rubraurantiaca TaxID=2811429 RepID=UPI001A95B525|nr:C1 family peptidase [Sabulicella rubraurantiaca]
MATKPNPSDKSPPTRGKARNSKAGRVAERRRFDALPDTLDFRDQLYVPALVAVPPASDLAAYRAHRLPVLDQGTEGACTGFGLAAVANYLLRVRGRAPKADEVSAWMLYTMARRYDEWPGEAYEGSSARGAVKGWHKHGLCSLALWRDNQGDLTLNEKRSANALQRPLGAYFRVNHKDLVSMHAAITEVGVLYATAQVHEGWQKVRPGDEQIDFHEGVIGGHAFAIVGYDNIGFWIQNSWGKGWGSSGLARLGYGDWLANGTDVWVAALGAPVDFGLPVSQGRMIAGAPRSYESAIYATLRPHIVTTRNDGVLDEKGTYGLTEQGLRNVIHTDLPKAMSGWRRRRVVLYAHGGLVEQSTAVQYVAENRARMLQAEAYPLSFIWRSDAWATLGNILRDAMARRRSEGPLDALKDFMFDRLDDMLEPVARALGGRTLWDEMKENAHLAAAHVEGAARQTADHLVALHMRGDLDEVHLVAHSAGSILLAPLAQQLAKASVPIPSLSLWAPACTIELFQSTYRPLIDSGQIGAFDLFTLDDRTERDDHCAHIYHKSLLYLVSAALEAQPRIPWQEHQQGTPILGLARDVAKHLREDFWNGDDRRWIVAPGAKESDAAHHGDFDNDPVTRMTTLRRICGEAAAGVVAEAPRMGSAAGIQGRRQSVEAAIGMVGPTRTKASSR